MKTGGPIETKVVAAAAGAGLGGSVTSFVLWSAGVQVWGQPATAQAAEAAKAAVPQPVAQLIVDLVAVGAAFLAGWLAPHTPRPDIENPAPAQPAEPQAVRLT